MTMQPVETWETPTWSLALAAGVTLGLAGVLIFRRDLLTIPEPPTRRARAMATIRTTATLGTAALAGGPRRRPRRRQTRG